MCLILVPPSQGEDFLVHQRQTPFPMINP
jgi:hypothetical protein